MLGLFLDWLDAKIPWHESPRIIEYSQWIGWFKFIDREGDKVYYLWLKTPSYCEAYQLARDEFRWSQRVLVWRSKSVHWNKKKKNLFMLYLPIEDNSAAGRIEGKQ